MSLPVLSRYALRLLQQAVEHHSDEEHHSSDHDDGDYFAIEHSSDHSDHDGHADENTLDVRIISIFAILVAGVIGALVPLFFKVRGVGC